MESIGQQLKVARERKGVTASQAAAVTHLKVQHVEALERNDYSRMAAPTYAKGFLKIYADYLGLDPAPLVREYTLRYAPQPTTQAATDATAARTVPSRRPFKLPEFNFPAMPAVPPELLRRLAWGLGAMVIVVALLAAVRRGCHRSASTMPTPPVATNAVTSQNKPAAPWVIVNEPPPPYYKRPAASTTTP